MGFTVILDSLDYAQYFGYTNVFCYKQMLRYSDSYLKCIYDDDVYIFDHER